MGIVGTYHETFCYCNMIFLIIFSTGRRKPFQDIFHECGISSLPCQASNFLIVKDTIYFYGTFIFPLKESLQRCPGALKVIKPWGCNHFIVCPNKSSCITAAKENVTARDFLKIYAGSLCYDIHQSFILAAGEDRKHVVLHIVLHTIICLTVHVDCKAWNHQKIFINIEKFFLVIKNRIFF